MILKFCKLFNLYENNNEREGYKDEIAVQYLNIWKCIFFSEHKKLEIISKIIKYKEMCLINGIYHEEM